MDAAIGLGLARSQASGVSALAETDALTVPWNAMERTAAARVPQADFENA